MAFTASARGYQFLDQVYRFGDVALTGFDDILWAETTRPRLTTMRVDSRQMGRMAVRLLRARLQNPDGAPSVTVIQPELVRRESA